MGVTCARLFEGIDAIIWESAERSFAPGPSEAASPPPNLTSERRHSAPRLSAIFRGNCAAAVLTALAMAMSLQATAATIDARQFCERSLSVRTGILEAVPGARATCEPGDPDAVPPVPARYETTLTDAQLASIRHLDLALPAPDIAAYALWGEFMPGDLDGLTGVRKLTASERSFTEHALHGAATVVSGATRSAVHPEHGPEPNHGCRLLRGPHELARARPPTQQPRLRTAGQSQPAGAYHRRRAFDQSRSMEPAAQPAQAQDREQPDPDPAAGVLPPPHPARRARHVRHVVRVPPIRVRVPGAPGRDLRRIEEAAKARPRVQRDRRRTGRRWAVRRAQRDPRDRSHPQPLAQEAAEKRARPARRGRDPDGPGRPVA